jgi:hypothetical protein
MLKFSFACICSPGFEPAIVSASRCGGWVDLYASLA